MASKKEQLKTEIVYSAQKGDFRPGVRYSNPRFFDTPKSGVTKVIICGNWPNVVAAYSKIKGVEIIECDTSGKVLRVSGPIKSAKVSVPAAPSKPAGDKTNAEDDAAKINGAPSGEGTDGAERDGDTDRDGDEGESQDEGDEGKEPSDFSKVEIPADWRDLTWPLTRKLASSLSDDPITDKATAVAAIEAELARRAAA